MKKILEYFGISTSDFAAAVLNVLMIVVLFFVLFKLLSLFFKQFEKQLLKRNSDTNVGPLRFAKYASIATVAFFCLSAIGSYFPALNKLFTSLLAGSGVVALVISVASQDAISNIVSGVLIIASQPFKIGDVIRYVDKNITGVVEEMTLRHTIIRTFENNRLVIPNSTMNSAVIENYNYNDNRSCMFLDIVVSYGSDTEKAVRIFADVIKNHPLYRNYDPACTDGMPKVRIVDCDTTGITIRGWLWSDNMLIGVDVKSDILTELRKRFRAEGIHFAYPHMVVIPHKDHNNSDTYEDAK